MKNCVNCGTALTDEVSFCTVCGTPQAAPAEVASQPAPQSVAEQPAPQPAYTPPVYVAPPAPHCVPAQPEKQSVSVGGWIGRYCLNLIPFAGGLVFFIMLWVWAFSDKYDDTSRSWAKAQLIWMAIAVGLVLLLVILMLALGFTMADVMDEALYY